ncbi:molybdopterin molybdochelatase [Cyclobacterium lianum]|uniref:Molybdopterin molybdenumtransferase n=1 Tax=Cyclobacterium lianum TaxID=388280 RepID=A0A1M7L8F1_9BACT|nr:molybdopterin molybdotransferase MoeA [Cyclobacterium lianum]SHM73668.1 molybdopterin molybdochelatase [Cyclobacterium lianum]
MKSVAEALQQVLSQPLPQTTEIITLPDTLGRILAQDIRADRDAPPFHRVTMDGIAIDCASLPKKTSFPIEAIQPAGDPQGRLSNSANCIEVMTGAILPHNSNCVIPYEALDIAEGIATLKRSDYTENQNVHLKGTDARKGDLLIARGTEIQPGTIGLMASVGLSEVQVFKFPKITVCSTGNELVDIAASPLPHQIRKSNVYMLQAALKSMGIEACQSHIEDDRQQLKEAVKTLLAKSDVLMFSGAVSKGKYDFLPEILEELGVRKLVHGVAQKPGKPFFFGRTENTIIFGFPGNPASTLICFHLYFKSWYQSHWGVEQRLQARLTEDITFQRPVTYHLLVKVRSEDGILLAEPIGNSGSGDLVQLAGADGIISLPPHLDTFAKGTTYPLTLFAAPWL